MQKSRKEATLSLNHWPGTLNIFSSIGETENSSDEKYEQFEKLKREAEDLYRQSNVPFTSGVENMKREVQCYKEMYKLAKEKQASRQFILYDILTEGFDAAVQGYLQVIISTYLQFTYFIALK